MRKIYKIKLSANIRNKKDKPKIIIIFNKILHHWV